MRGRGSCQTFMIASSYPKRPAHGRGTPRPSGLGCLRTIRPPAAAVLRQVRYRATANTPHLAINAGLTVVGRRAYGPPVRAGAAAGPKFELFAIVRAITTARVTRVTERPLSVSRPKFAVDEEFVSVSRLSPKL